MTDQPKRPGQAADESAMEYLRRAVGWLDKEPESMLEQLPTVEAVLGFFELWNAYGTDFWSGVMECIAEGDDPTPARDFVAKHKLPKSWRQEIDQAVASTPEALRGELNRLNTDDSKHGPETFADLAAKAESLDAWQLAADCWRTASGYTLGHSRAARYEAAADRCRKQAELAARNA